MKVSLETDLRDSLGGVKKNIAIPLSYQKAAQENNVQQLLLVDAHLQDVKALKLELENK